MPTASDPGGLCRSLRKGQAATASAFCGAICARINGSNGDERREKIRSRKPLIGILLMAAAAYSQNNTPPEGFRLQDGTPVRLRLQRTMSSGEAQVNEQVDFEVLDEVKVNGVSVIPKGSIAWGTVTNAQPKRRMARGGKLDINIDAVRMASGEKAALRAVKVASGGGHTGAMTGAMVATSLVVWPAAPFFLFMHGKDITIPKGTEITAFINGDVDIKSPATTGEAARSAPAQPTQTLAGAAPQSRAPSVQPTPSPDGSTVVIKSDPDDGEIMIDGKFVGNTPSTVQFPPGDHDVVVTRLGFKPWQRSVAISSGSIVNVSAKLERN
jgi:hypothetical protein